MVKVFELNSPIPIADYLITGLSWDGHENVANVHFNLNLKREGNQAWFIGPGRDKIRTAVIEAKGGYIYEPTPNTPVTNELKQALDIMSQGYGNRIHALANIGELLHRFCHNYKSGDKNIALKFEMQWSFANYPDFHIAQKVPTSFHLFFCRGGATVEDERWGQFCAAQMLLDPRRTFVALGDNAVSDSTGHPVLLVEPAYTKFNELVINGKPLLRVFQGHNSLVEALYQLMLVPTEVA